MEINKKDGTSICVVENPPKVINFSIVYDFKSIYDPSTEMEKLYNLYVKMDESDEYTYDVINRLRTLMFEYLETLCITDDVVIRYHDIRRPNEWRDDLSIVTELYIKKGEALNLVKIQNPSVYEQLMAKPVFMLEIYLDDIL